MTEFQSLINSLSSGKLITAVLVLILTAFLVRGLKALLEYLGNRFTRYRLQITRLFPLYRIILWWAAISFIILNILALPEAALLAATATVGVAIGLAAQDSLKNMISGMTMLFTRPFRVGDMIRVANHYGEVISIDLQLTHLRTFTDDEVTIPNSVVLNQAVVNSNSGELTEMVSADFVLPADIDIHTVKSIALEAAYRSPFTYLKKPVAVAIEDASTPFPSTRFIVKVYVIDVRMERLLTTDIIERIKSELQLQGLLKPRKIEDDESTTAHSASSFIT